MITVAPCQRTEFDAYRHGLESEASRGAPGRAPPPNLEEQVKTS